MSNHSKGQFGMGLPHGCNALCFCEVIDNEIMKTVVKELYFIFFPPQFYGVKDNVFKSGHDNQHTCEM